MGVIQSTREFFARRTPRQGVVARIVPKWLENRPLTQKHETRKLLDEGYRRHSIIHVCISEIAQTVAEPIPRIVRDGKILEQHPALDLLKKPNPLQTWYEFAELFLIYLESVGNVYVHKVRAAGGRVVELWLLRPDRTKIVPGPDGMVLRYEFSIDGMPTGIHLPPEDVVHCKLPDPLDDYYGLPPVAVAAALADLDTNSIDYLRAFFLNSGTPAGILKFKIKVEKAERERVKLQWEEQHTGLNGWHSISVLDADADYQPIGAVAGETGTEKVFDITESRLCAIWGVPPIVVGMRLGISKATYANYASARASFWQETMRPMYRRIQAKLTAGIVHEIDPRAELLLDLADVDALQESIDSRRKYSIDGWREGLLSRKQALDLVKMESAPGDENRFSTDVGDLGLEPEMPPPLKALPPVDDDEQEGLPAPRAVALIEGPTEAQNIPQEPVWKTLHRVADKGSLALRRAFLKAVANAVNGTVLTRVEAALKAKDYAAAEAAIPWESAAVRSLEADMPEALRKVIVEAGVAVQGMQPAGLKLVFNVANPLAVEAAAHRSAALVQEISDQTRLAIRDIIARSINEGRSARTSAREIRDVIGLTRRQEQSIENLRAKLAADGLKGDDIQEQLRKARQRLVRRRSVLISRTESIWAANEGQQLLWQQAETEGVIDRQMYREFVTTPDDRRCDFCAPMNGKRVLLNEPFKSGQVARSNGTSVQLPDVMVPPLHPACRCCLRLVVE